MPVIFSVRNPSHDPLVTPLELFSAMKCDGISPALYGHLILFKVIKHSFANVADPNHEASLFASSSRLAPT